MALEQGDHLTREEFERLYRNRFSFLMPDRALVAEAVSVEAVGRADAPGGLIVASPVSIAKKLKVPYDDLMAANHIDDPHKLQIGQKLIIPTKPTKAKKGD